MIVRNKPGYSAKVDLKLVVDGETLDVMQTCSDRVILKSPRAVRGGEAEILITIDGETDAKRIVLIGNSEPSCDVEFW